MFLLLGAIVNVAVAWGCAWKLDVFRVPGTGESSSIAGEVGETPSLVWGVSRYERTGATRLVSYYFMPSKLFTDYDGDPDSLLPSWNQDYLSGFQRVGLNEPIRLLDGLATLL